MPQFPESSCAPGGFGAAAGAGILRVVGEPETGRRPTRRGPEAASRGYRGRPHPGGTLGYGMGAPPRSRGSRAISDRAATRRPGLARGGAAHNGTAPQRPRSLVPARITPLRLEAFDQLPKHARRCVFWEVDPATLGQQDQLADPEFEKEAWLSMVMLEWGSCGQVAIAISDEHSSTEPPCLGYVLYAPPGAVPRAHRFPTAPVSPDAVLLTSMGIEPGHAPDDLPHSLLAQVIVELVRRGVRALEAFGRTPAASELSDPQLADPDTRPVLESLGDCSVDRCIIDADFLKDVGFVVVAQHP